MGAGDELRRRLAVDRIDRHPHRYVLRALDVVVRLVLVPGRLLPCTGFLDEHVVVKEAHLRRAHQLACDRGRRRLTDELLELGDALPVAKVLEEAPRIVRARCDERPLARLREVALDPALDERDLLGRERTADADRPVAPKVFVAAHPPILVTMAP